MLIHIIKFYIFAQVLNKENQVQCNRTLQCLTAEVVSEQKHTRNTNFRLIYQLSKAGMPVIYVYLRATKFFDYEKKITHWI